MTVHRIRLFHSTSGSASFHSWLSVWLTNMDPWTDPEVDNTVPQPHPAGGYMGELAFEWHHDRAIILDQIDGYAAAHCNWHRIGYHECSHDETDPTPCQWDERRESGAVPSHVPLMAP